MKYCKAATAGFVVLLLIAVFMLSTTLGLRLSMTGLAWYLKTSYSYKMQTEGMQGNLWRQSQFQKIILDDQHGHQIEIQDLLFKWQPWAWWSKGCVVDEWSTSAVKWPETWHVKAEPSKKTISAPVFPWFKMPAIQIGKLDLKNLCMHDNFCFKVHGSINTHKKFLFLRAESESNFENTVILALKPYAKGWYLDWSVEVKPNHYVPNQDLLPERIHMKGACYGHINQHGLKLSIVDGDQSSGADYFAIKGQVMLAHSGKALHADHLVLKMNHSECLLHGDLSWQKPNFNLEFKRLPTSISTWSHYLSWSTFSGRWSLKHEKDQIMLQGEISSEDAQQAGNKIAVKGYYHKNKWWLAWQAGADTSYAKGEVSAKLQEKREHLQVSFTANMAELAKQLAWPEHQVKGDLEGDLSYNRGNLSGHVALQHGHYVYVPYGTLLKNINVAVKFSDDDWLIEGDAQDITGQSLLITSKDKASQIIFNHNKLADNPQFSLTTSGHIQIEHTKNSESTAIKGELVVDELHYHLEHSGLNDVPSINVVDSYEEDLSPEIYAVPNIKIKIPKKLFIDGYGIFAELEGELSIKNSWQNILGQFNVRQGRMVFLDHKFLIDKGKINLGKKTILFQLQGQSNIRDKHVTLRLHGQPDSIHFDLSSLPPLPQSELISEIIFNRSTVELSPMQAIQLARVINDWGKFTPSGNAFDYLSKVKNLLSLDDLTVSAKDAKNVKLGAGKYISDDIYVNVEQSLSGQDKTTTLEVGLTPSISVETTRSTDQTLEKTQVNWKYRY